MAKYKYKTVSFRLRDVEDMDNFIAFYKVSSSPIKKRVGLVRLALRFYYSKMGFEPHDFRKEVK